MKQAATPSRERQILDWLGAHPAGGRFGEMHQAIAPTIAVSNFAGSISTLLRRGKIERSGKCRLYVYMLVATPPADRRRKVTACTAPVAKATSGKRARVVSGIPTAPAAAAPIVLPPTTRLPPEIEAKQGERESLAQDVAAFLAAGGVIQRLVPGEHSRHGISVAQQQAEYLKQQLHKGEPAQHRRANRAA